jgi:mannose-6-phosphate isomerase-like protein (cupin superfamily)
MKIRRVVTGHDENGKAVFVSDEEVEPLTLAALPGAEFHRLWGADSAPRFPDRGEPPAQPTFFPPVNGFRFLFFTIPPQSTAAPDVDPGAAESEVEEKLPGMSQWMEPDDPGMHTTDTVDYAIVLEGEIWSVMDEGETLLRAGDVLIQRGTNHAWANRSGKTARIAFVLMDGKR